MRWHRRRPWIYVAIVIAAVALILLYRYADFSQGYMPRCIVHTLTGWDCPGCGSQRMIQALLKGEFLRAWQYNYFLIPFLIILTVPFALTGVRRRHRVYDRFITSTPVAVALAILPFVWMLIRNICGI